MNYQAAEPVVTDEWWLAGSLASYFTTHEMYTAHTDEDFSDWLSIMRSNNVTGFTYISASPVDLSSVRNFNHEYHLQDNKSINGLSFVRYSLIP